MQGLFVGRTGRHLDVSWPSPGRENGFPYTNAPVVHGEPPAMAVGPTGRVPGRGVGGR
jgi:hypothetical protein